VVERIAADAGITAHAAVVIKSVVDKMNDLAANV